MIYNVGWIDGAQTFAAFHQAPAHSMSDVTHRSHITVAKLTFKVRSDDLLSRFNCCNFARKTQTEAHKFRSIKIHSDEIFSSFKKKKGMHELLILLMTWKICEQSIILNMGRMIEGGRKMIICSHEIEWKKGPQKFNRSFKKQRDREQEEIVLMLSFHFVAFY